MSSFAQSLYAQMLRGRELSRQRKLEEQRYTDAQSNATFQQSLNERAAADQEIQKAFDRQMEVAKLQQGNAAMLGKAYEGGYANPAVEEFARASFDAGQVAAGKQAADRKYKYDQLANEMLQADLDFRKSALGTLGGIETSGYAQQTPYARAEYMPALLDTSRARPSPAGPLSQRVDISELERRHGGIDAAGRLRQELQGQQTYKNMQSTAEAYNKVMSASDTGAGDISSLYSFVKLLDSSSAVREGEVGLAQTIAGYQGLVKSWFEKAKGGVLDPEIVRQIKVEARKLYEATHSRYSNWTKNYEEEARRLSIDPNRVVFEDFNRPDVRAPSTADRASLMLKLESLTDQYVNSGMSVEDAKRQAKSDLGVQ